MTYEKFKWQPGEAGDTMVTADRLNHLETQFDEAKTYADGKFISTVASATATQKGVVELATSAEAVAGSDATRAVTPAALRAVVDTIPGASTDMRAVDPARYGVPTDGTTAAQSAFQAMLNSLPNGAEVSILPGQRFRLTAPVKLSKPVTIRGGEFIANTTGTTFLIDSDDVTLDGVKLTGPGAALGVVLEQYFIMTSGTATRPLKRTHITDCVFTGCQSSFLWLEWLTDFLIENNHISDGQYSGIMMISPKQGVIRDNTVRTLLQGGTLVNSYGIAVTDILNTAAARAEYVEIEGNFVSDVPGWKGIDTHGGKGIQAVNNRILRCRTGISFTTGNDNRLMPPEDGLIAGNIIELGGISNQNAAIVLNGKSGGPYPDRFATGAIGPNVITGYAVDLDLQYCRKDKLTVAPQAHNGSTRRSPTQEPFRIYTASAVVSKPAGSAVGTKAIQFPPGLFTARPIVSVTKSSGAGAAFIPYADGITEKGFTASAYHAAGSTAGDYSIPVDITAIQATPTGDGMPTA